MANDNKQIQQRSVGPQTPVQHGRGVVGGQQMGLAQVESRGGETASTAMAAKQAALVQARYAIAIARPRDLDVVRERLLKECQRPSFADAAIYHKPIGDGIEGPSIRFVEAALAAMGNVWSDIETVAETDDSRTIRVEVTDAENNVGFAASVTIHKTVERNSIRPSDEVIRSRTGSRGQTVYVKRASDDEILNTANALTSKALRTVGLRIIPGWLKDECMEACEKTRANRDAVDPESAKRKLFDAFALVGISTQQLKDWLQHDGSNLTAKERTTLLGLYNAIKAGETTWTEVMDARWNETLERGAVAAAVASGSAPAAPKPGAAGLADRVKQAATQAAPKKEAPMVCGVCGQDRKLNADGLCADCAMPGDAPEPGSDG